MAELYTLLRLTWIVALTALIGYGMPFLISPDNFEFVLEILYDIEPSLLNVLFLIIASVFAYIIGLIIYSIAVRIGLYFFDFEWMLWALIFQNISWLFSLIGEIGLYPIYVLNYLPSSILVIPLITLILVSLIARINSKAVLETTILPDTLDPVIGVVSSFVVALAKGLILAILF